jgi:Bacterial Ig-like domain (group 3)
LSFYAGDTALGTDALDAKGMATLSTSALTNGEYNVKAVYSGSAAFAESASAPIEHVVQ